MNNGDFLIKAIFFDVDDTMYDHLYPFQRAIANEVLHLEHFPFEAAYHRMRYYSDKLSVQYGGAEAMAKQGIDRKMQAERFLYALADFNVHISFEQAEKIQQIYLATQFDISTFANMDKLLVQLKEKGYIVGLLTNGAEKHQRKKIKALQLERYIDADKIFISGAFGIDKPNPAIFHHISKQINISAEHCLYVGDSWRNDVIGATEAGWHMLWFNHRKQETPQSHIIVEQVNSIEQLIQFFNSY